MNVIDKFQFHLDHWSDIQSHLPFLFEQAKGKVLEFGVRDGVSTAALLAGVETKGGHLISVDINQACQTHFLGHPAWRFMQGDSIDSRLALELAPFLDGGIDVLFLDTLHTYDHVLAELILWGTYVRAGGVILIHDAITFEGVKQAILEYATIKRLPFSIRDGSNGLGVIYV